MAWFKKLALFLITVLPCVTAHPTVDSRHRPVFATEGLESEGQYIITLQNSLSPIEFRSHLSRVNAVQYRNSHDSNNHGSGGVHKTYAIGDYHAYSGTFDQDTIRAIWNDTKVSRATHAGELVESNAVGCLQVADIELDTVYALQGHSQLVRQYKAPWGLAALSNKKRGSSTYRYDKSAGYGTFAYILDSGINTKHVDFGGRASLGYNAVNKDFTDVNGHGTHVAGIIGSKSFGVAKQTELIGVKVMINNEAFVSTILDGYQWAVNDILTKNRQNRAVINMSLGKWNLIQHGAPVSCGRGRNRLTPR